MVQAMEAGFTRALATIVDSNLTTLIAAGVLFFLGRNDGISGIPPLSIGAFKMLSPDTIYYAIWIAVLALPASLEVWTLVNGTPGDTLSAQVWTLLDAHPTAAFPIAAGLIWLAVHLLGRRGQG